MKGVSQQFLIGAVLPHKGHLAMAGDIFHCYNRRVVLAFSGERPGVLLNIL